MSKGRKSDFTLPTLDDLFSTQQERDEAKLDKIRDIPLSEIDDFPDHPFQVRDDEDMIQLVESIRENGVMTPAVLRIKDDGRYEIVAGHRRKRACELAGLDTLRSEIKDLSRDEAVVYMVESNFQRSTILPSEKGFAYKMRMDAMKRQGKRTDLTSSPLATKLGVGRSDIELSEQVGESKDQIRRYIRLTYLIPELLQLVDDGKMKMRPAVELSYLGKDCQQDVFEQIELNQCTPSHAQTIRMRKMHEEHKLTPEAVEAIMSEEKPNQRERMVFNADRMRKLLPKDVTPAKTEDFICDAIEFYCKYGRGRYQGRESKDRNAR
ncbi:ParB/RepB/Spo0J family partition protein [Ruminococcus sp.]|uniref:ParB/RepB/Spo0J family partition protein n=1 Tax=Ruminococcus sp. TaxID=41978 RepID=UPI00388DB14D